MSYDIVWEPDAARDLDAAWEIADSSFRREIERAMKELHAALRDDPRDAGESRGLFEERVAIARPLTVYYRIDRRQQFVAIHTVVLYGPS